MISDSTVDLILELIMSVLANQYTVGYPGKSNGAGGYDIYVTNDPGRVWVRIWDGENVTITKATAVGRTALDPALRVLMRRVHGELIIDLPDPASARQLYGFYTEQAGAPLAFTTAVDDPGMVTASASGGMKVIVHAYPAGGFYNFVDNIDLTADEPGSTNQFRWDVNYILNGVLGWAQSTPQTLSSVSLLQVSDARAVVLPAGSFRTYAVSLANGQTDINQSRFVDLRDTLVAFGAGIVQSVVAGSNISVDNTDPANPIVTATGGAGGLALIVLKDLKTQNTDGGTFTSTAWRTRDLNTKCVDTGSNCTLSSNQFALLAGTYRLTAYIPAQAVNRNQARLYNVTDSAVQQDTGGNDILSQSVFAAAPANAGSLAIIEARFTLASTKTLRIEHQCQTTEATNGFGVAGNLAQETYTVVRIEKE